MTVAGHVNLILLAGDRGPDDPLAAAAGVAGKALVPVAGRPMLSRVLMSLARWPRLGRLILVAPDLPEYRQAAASAGLSDDRLCWVLPEPSPSMSVAAALAVLDDDVPAIMTTADHVLIRVEWLEQLLDGTPASADLSVGLVSWHRVMARFPESRRTRYRFHDIQVCGCNLFLFRTKKAHGITRTWRRIEQQRKQPWRIVSLLGWFNLLRYLAGRLSLANGFKALGKATGLNVAPVVLEDPLMAVDVDSAQDLVLVERVLKDQAA